MKRILFVLFVLSLAGLSCIDSAGTPAPGLFAGVRTATPSPDPGEEPTSQSWTREAMGLEALRAEATLEDAQIHAEQWRVSQTAASLVLTEDANQKTRAASSVETERAWTVQGWTATADVVYATERAASAQTAQAIGATQTQSWESARMTATAQVISLQATIEMGRAHADATSDAAISAAQSTVVAAEALGAQLAAERQRKINTVVAWLPYLVGVLVIALLLYLGWRWGRTRAWQSAIVRGADGAPVMLLDERGGSIRVILPDRIPGPAAVSKKTGLDFIGANPQLLADIIRRQQAIQALKAIGQAGSRSPEARRLLQSATQPGPTPASLRVVESAKVQGWLAEVGPQIFTDALEGEVVENGPTNPAA